MTALRGYGLTSHSYENDAHVVPLDTVRRTYHCPLGHEAHLRFHPEAEDIPQTWDCPRCGRTAHADEAAAARAAEAAGGQALSSPRTAVSAKTHRDMLHERRTSAELEDLLAERLRHLRASRAS